MLEQDGLRQLDVDVDSYFVKEDGKVDYGRVSDVYESIVAEIQRVKNIEREAVKKELLAGKGEPTVEDQFDTDEEADGPVKEELE